eukprot:scaffold57844_cov98-Phaeocystis_antarctica.AAC.1
MCSVNPSPGWFDDTLRGWRGWLNRLLSSVSSAARGKKSLRGQTSKSKRKSGSRRLSARPRPPVLDARPPLCRHWWGKARGCPSPACLQRSWWSATPDFVIWVDPPFGANGARRHIWQRPVSGNRICASVASADYFHACMARGSQRAVGQALQPICLQRAHGPICSQGVRGYLSAQASVAQAGSLRVYHSWGRTRIRQL